MQEFRIKFKPTDITYSLPEEEVRRIWKEDGGRNYELIDKIYIPPMEVIPVSTTFEQVVEEEEVRSFYDYTAEELRAFCEANGLKKSGNKADLLERCLDFTQQIVDEQENETPEEVASDQAEQNVENEVVEETEEENSEVEEEVIEEDA